MRCGGEDVVGDEDVVVMRCGGMPTTSLGLFIREAIPQ